MGRGARLANVQRRVITEYGPDPNDARATGLMSGLWQRVQGSWTSRYGIANGAPEGTFNGTLTRSQPFLAGTSQLGANANPYRSGGSPGIDSGLIEGPMGDPARQIFAARMRRRMGGDGS